jgi:GntR family transcriptional regulator
MITSLRDPRDVRYLKIADQLRQAILDGTLAPGCRLPGQRELAQQHDTTLMTVRQALALLEAEGLIRFAHGVGTFVTDTMLDPDARPLASLGETSGLPALRTVLRSAEPSVEAPEAARLLGLSPETPLVRIERLRLLGEEPVAYQHSFLPPALAGLIPSFCPDRPLYRQLQEQFGERAVASRETLQPVVLAAAQALLLARPAGAPAFRSCRLSLNLHDRPLVYDEALLAGDRWLLVGDRLGRRGDWGLHMAADGHEVLAALVQRGD